MNYIARLQAEAVAKDAEIAALRAGLEDFRIFVATSPKFGNRPMAPISTVDRDGLPAPVGGETGERLDWIATGDVIRRIQDIEAAGTLAGEG